MSASVVIPLYNKEKAIGPAVTSVLAQTHGDFELLIVNDGSTDNSVEIVSGFKDARISVISQQNAGPGAARNAGIRASRRPYVAFLDADDEWESDYLATCIGRLDENRKCMAHVSGYFIGPGKATCEPRHRARGIKPGSFSMPSSVDAAGIKYLVDFFHSSCIVARREVLDKYGGYYAKNRCLYGEDSYLWLAVLLNEVTYLDPAPHVWFHTEFSELGAKRVGFHPRRPALTDPQPLRAACRPDQQRNLARLLAYYRLIETEKLIRSGTVPFSEMRRLYSAFPWPDLPPGRLAKREIAVWARRLAGALPFLGRGRTDTEL